MMNGQHFVNAPSLFLKEIPSDFIIQNKPVRAKAAEVSNDERYKLKADFSTKKPIPAPIDAKPDFEVGDKVKHIKFGKGEVLAINPAGADYEVTVDFGRLGKKKLMARLSKLVKV
jgi:DNA helicase-2/ATP-dependent DNA helicase PcrA